MTTIPLPSHVKMKIDTETGNDTFRSRFQSFIDVMPVPGNQLRLYDREKMSFMDNRNYNANLVVIPVQNYQNTFHSQKLLHGGKMFEKGKSLFMAASDEFTDAFKNVEKRNRAPEKKKIDVWNNASSAVKRKLKAMQTRKVKSDAKRKRKAKKGKKASRKNKKLSASERDKFFAGWYKGK